MKYFLKTNRVEYIALILSSLLSCLSLILFRWQVIFTTLFQIFAIIGLYEFKVKPIKFPDSDDNIISPVINVWASVFFIQCHLC